jgi:hypothetical protein
MNRENPEGTVAQLMAELQRLRGELAKRDQRIVELSGVLRHMQRATDDLLDRESMHVYDADMERLTTAASMDRAGAARARHITVIGATGAETSPGRRARVSRRGRGVERSR